MDINNEFLGKHKKFRVDNKKLATAFVALSFIVAIIVFWWLKLVGITVTGDVLCGLEEHSHIESCYTTELICGFAEKENIPESMTAEESTEESTAEAHIHTEECYNKSLICTISEHFHTPQCIPDTEADKESVGEWLNSFSDVKITNDIASNISLIAKSQVGYSESTKNFILDDNGEKRGYTRYGEWYGNPYGGWNTLFTAFCINYSNANHSEELIHSGAEALRLAWEKAELYEDSPDYRPTAGSIVFFDTNGDGTADRTGIVSFASDSMLITVEGDSNDKVSVITYNDFSSVMGYGTSEKLYAKHHLSDKELEEETTPAITASDGTALKYAPTYTKPSQENEDELTEATENEAVTEEIRTFRGEFNAQLFSNSASNAKINYTSHLEEELINAIIKDAHGNQIVNGSTIYVGESYIVALEFSEINSGSQWLQFEHNEDGYLTFQLPPSLSCEPFKEWHKITAVTEAGTVENVGEYFLDSTGLVRVRFFNNSQGTNFVDLYSNVDFTIEFNATVAASSSTDKTEIKFNDDINFDLVVDKGAGITVNKSHGEYDSNNHTMEYTIMVEATHGIVHDLVIDDQIWENHYILRDTVVVTDLQGNLIDPQPTVSDHPAHNSGAQGGMRISGFPEFSAGNGYLIKYKTKIHDDKMTDDYVNLWNGLDTYAKDSKNDDIYNWTDDWVQVELEKLEKDGKQYVLQDKNGNPVPVIEWEIIIHKSQTNLDGTVVIDTLGNGLRYYTDRDIYIVRYSQDGSRLPDMHISWNDITINGNSMSFVLPEGHAFDIVYYTTYEELAEDEQKEYSNSVSANINGSMEQTSGTAGVVGFIPEVKKNAKGTDGQYIYFTIEAAVPGLIKDWGNFYITDLAAFWGYNNAEGHLYVENSPLDMVITAVTESGRVIEFTPYVNGGPIENTYILVAPAEGDKYHSFNIFFNTNEATCESSKWISEESAQLTITYKLSFDALTGTEWEGQLSGKETLEDILIKEYTLANEVYLNYTAEVQGEGTAYYDYSPMITKRSETKSNGTITYTVMFYNSVPGTYNNEGYLSYADSIVFTDTFDDKLEYVEDSLTVTCYDPWRDYLWLNKYTYDGTIEGNTISVSADELVFSEYNAENAAYDENGTLIWGMWPAELQTYLTYCQNMGGGIHEFTYTLRLKDEYYNTTEHNTFLLDNTAELTWDENGTSGTVTETTEYHTGLLDKNVVQKDSTLDFDIHVNCRSLDIVDGSEHLIIEDTMTPNLSLYWYTIVLYFEDADGNWIDYTSPESEYSYTVTYDQVNNKLTFTIPDKLHTRITYSTLVTESGLIAVKNAAKIEGKAEVTDVINAIFKVEDHSGDASGSNHRITLLKHDGITFEGLPGATFLLYGPMGDENAALPPDAPSFITAEDGSVLSYIGSYTTGENGTVRIETQFLTEGGPYALVETVAPDGYELPELPSYFYFYDTDPNGIIQTVTTIVTIDNYNYSFTIPETGGNGALFTATIGTLLMTAPILYSILRSRRERRSAKRAPSGC